MESSNDNCHAQRLDSVAEENKLSKNARKRLLKRERQLATKHEWKARMREKRLKKKAAKGTSTSTMKIDTPQSLVPQSPPVQEAPSGQILIDLAYESLMTDREISSLVFQICRCYSINRKTTKPFKIIVSGLSENGRIHKELVRTCPEYQRWPIQFIGDSIEFCYTSIFGEMEPRVIYLSADSEEVLDSIDDHTTYIIGGLVDRNRHKNVAVERAKILNIKTAKLPIMRNVKLKSSQVLTIVHVFEIFCKQRELDNWSESIKTVIPERKQISFGNRA